MIHTYAFCDTLEIDGVIHLIILNYISGVIVSDIQLSQLLLFFVDSINVNYCLASPNLFMSRLILSTAIIIYSGSVYSVTVYGNILNEY